MERFTFKTAHEKNPEVPIRAQFMLYSYITFIILIQFPHAYNMYAHVKNV